MNLSRFGKAIAGMYNSAADGICLTGRGVLFFALLY